MRSPVAPACTVRVSLILTLQPRDEQEPCAGRGIFGSRKPTGTPEPGSSWNLTGRTGGPRRARWLLLVPVTAERLTLMSLLRVQGATESPEVSEGTGVSPHTGPETIVGLSSPEPQGCSVVTHSSASSRGLEKPTVNSCRINISATLSKKVNNKAIKLRFF